MEGLLTTNINILFTTAPVLETVIAIDMIIVVILRRVTMVK